MKTEHIQKIIGDLGHIRISASKEEKYTAEYLAEECRAMGLNARVETFEVSVTTIHEAHLYANGKEIPCTGYEFCGSGSVEAPLVYLPAVDAAGLTKVKDKIVLIDTTITHFDYHDLLDHGALGIITYDGDVKYQDHDIDTRELRDFVSNGRKTLCAHVNAKDAVQLVRDLPVVRIEISQTEGTGESYNTIAEIPGETDQWIVVSAHLDSRPTAPGVYDNLTGCIGVLSVLEKLKETAPNRYGIRACFVGSEERALLGSKAYVRDHADELDKITFDINIDMIGAIMGRLICACTCEENMVSYIRNCANDLGVSIQVMARAMSSDSSAFADKGVPALSFGKMAPRAQAVIHSRYDDGSTVTAKQIREDAEFIEYVAGKLANTVVFPVRRNIPEKIKKQLDEMFYRKRREENVL